VYFQRLVIGLISHGNQTNARGTGVPTQRPMREQREVNGSDKIVGANLNLQI